MQSHIRTCFAVLFTALVTGLASAADPAPEQKAWSILEAGTNEKNFTTRSEAIYVLGLLPGNFQAVAMAEKALTDPAPEVREAGATALGQMQSHSSIPKLEQALDDKEISVVLAAAHSLWTLHDTQAFEVYYEILIGERKSGQGLIAGKEKMLRDRKKLAELGFEEGIGFVPYASMGWGVAKSIYKEKEGDASPVRAAAAKMLAEDPDPHSARALVKACSDKSWVVRAAALDALARRGDPAALKDIEPRLSDEKEIVRYTAAAAVIRLSGATPSARAPEGSYSERDEVEKLPIPNSPSGPKS
jgi:HEAT repeat protein